MRAERQRPAVSLLGRRPSQYTFFRLSSATARSSSWIRLDSEDVSAPSRGAVIKTTAARLPPAARKTNFLINIRFLLFVAFFASTDFLRLIPLRFYFLCLTDIGSTEFNFRRPRNAGLPLADSRDWSPIDDGIKAGVTLSLRSLRNVISTMSFSV